MAKKKITIENLAVMVQKGFAETATKAKFKELIEELKELRKNFKKRP